MLMGRRPGSSVQTEFDELDFAKDALSRVSIIAADVGARKKSCVAGRLAAQLWIARIALDSADSSQLSRLQKRLPKLMDDLERVCAWPKEPEPLHPILRSILRKETYRSLQEAEARVQDGLLAFASGPTFVKDQYFKKLDHFSRRTVVKDEDERAAKTEASAPDDYPAHVNASLYAVLRDHSSCTCTADHSVAQSCDAQIQRHPGRLRLRAEMVKENGGVAFEMLLSASPRADDYWQDVQVSVVMRKSGKKSVKYADALADVTTSLSNRGSVGRSRLLPPAPGSLCSLARSRPGARICCWVRDLELQQLHDASPIAQHVSPGPSLSLRSILETHRLSNRMKLVLAYIVSRSFWQYYDSPWMNTKWCSDTIHFLPERRPDNEEEDDDDDDDDLEDDDNPLYASRPYYVVDFVDEPGPFVEYCDFYSVIYRYPRLLALCIMLLEIGRGKSLSVDESGSMEAVLNSNWDLAQRLLKRPKAWGDFDYPDYRRAISSCLNGKLFDDAGLESENAQADLVMASRKAVLYESVVLPLERLLKKLGYWDELYNVGPIDSRGPGAALTIPVSKPLPLKSTLGDTEAGQSGEWLHKLANINNYIHNLSRQAGRTNQTARRRIRVAILDTGYDAEAVFFGVSSRRQRLKGWMDCVDGLERPVDENGHGTHTVSLLMKVAPLADIYVARVAKDRGNLRAATENIRDAIIWATTDCEADIISMSLGFQEEIPSISAAIHEATMLRNNRILFFAAASNSGGNGREMFPASHDAVISIRATNSHGAFLDTNPPADHYGPAVYGTLGKDVPSAWLSNVDGELSRSGSSVATAVAAGVAAMMLAFANAGFSSAEFRLPLEVSALLWTRRGMLAMFAKMSQDMGSRCFFISPVRFFAERDSVKVWAAMIDACS